MKSLDTLAREYPNKTGAELIKMQEQFIENKNNIIAKKSSDAVEFIEQIRNVPIYTKRGNNNGGEYYKLYGGEISVTGNIIVYYTVIEFVVEWGGSRVKVTKSAGNKASYHNFKDDASVTLKEWETISNRYYELPDFN